MGYAKDERAQGEGGCSQDHAFDFYGADALGFFHFFCWQIIYYHKILSGCWGKINKIEVFRFELKIRTLPGRKSEREGKSKYGIKQERMIHLGNLIFRLSWSTVSKKRMNKKEVGAYKSIHGVGLIMESTIRKLSNIQCVLADYSNYINPKNGVKELNSAISRVFQSIYKMLGYNNAKTQDGGPKNDVLPEHKFCRFDFKSYIIQNTQQNLMKTIDKYQFNEQTFTLQEGIQTHIATHIVLKRKFELKMVSQGCKNEKDNYNYLIKEAQVLKKVVHPHIYKCHKLLRSKNNFYVIFDHLQGQTLDDFMKKNIHFDTKLQIMKQIIQTMLVVSEFKIAYLSLNPQHIIIDDNYKITLKNFGFAEEFQPNSDCIEIPHFSGKITPYSPPELQKGKVYQNSDAYSIGMLIDRLFQKEFQFGVKQTSKTSYKIKYDKEKINVDLTLSLLKEMADSLVIKNSKDRLSLIKSIKPKQQPLRPPTMDKHLVMSKTNSYSPVKMQNNSAKVELSSSKQNEANFDSKSMRSISDIGEKRQLHFNNVEDLVLMIIKKRNFSYLLLKMSQICLNNKEASYSSTLILSFLLTKKAALVVSQLAKFVKQGINREISISAKLKEYFQKTPAYAQLLTLTNKQMIAAQHTFQQLLTKIKLIPHYNNNESLKSQVKYQRVNNSFLRRAILDFLLELQLLATDKYVSIYTKNNSLWYLYIISLASDYQTFEEMYDQLFTEGINGFEHEPFVKQLKEMNPIKVMELIEVNSSNLFSQENYRSPLAVKNAVTVKQ